MLDLGTVINGVVHGALAAIDALVLVLLYRTTRIVNLAQAAMGYVAGTFTGLLIVSGRWSFWWAAPVGIVIGAILGLATDRIVLRRLQDAPRAVVLVATVGLSQIFVAIAAVVALGFGGTLPTYSGNLFTLSVGADQWIGPDAYVTGAGFLSLVMLAVAWVSVHLFLNRSRFGLAALALGQEAERARALGVPAPLVRSVAWTVGGALAAVSGVLAIPVYGFTLGGGVGPIVLILALAPAVLAGFRNLNVAVIGALVLGVVYDVSYRMTLNASTQELIVGLAIVAALVLQYAAGRFFGIGALGREEAAIRASSWEAAATPRPLKSALVTANPVRIGAVVLAIVAVVIAILPALMLSPSSAVGYAQGAAFALAGLGVAVAWIFAGDISLGHWGLAAFGATIAAWTPGPWWFRCIIATAILAGAGALLGLGSRRRSVLSFAVITLAAAATARVMILRVTGRTIGASLERPAGAVAAALGVLTVIALIWLRRTRAGARMIAVRDDPGRAPWLGADLVRARMLALSISMGLGGLAGALYFAAAPLGLTTGGRDTSFEAVKSLELLAMVVIGGLGSPLGAFLGVAGMRAGQVFLPGTWASLLSGAGVLVVVIFAPAGLSRVLTRIRDLAVRLVAGRPPVEPHAPALREEVPV